MAQLEVLATDGKMQRRILWIDVRPKGIYVGWCIGGRGDHFSYHVDGKRFWTIDGKVHRTTDFPPLKEFKGIQQIGSFSFPASLSRLRAPAYTMTKLRAVAYIDVRGFVTDSEDVGCNLLLLEPERFDLLRHVVPTEMDYVFAQFCPWLVLQVYKVHVHQLD